MNPNVVKVGNKLFLGTQKVELGFVDDVKIIYESANKMYSNNSSELSKFTQKMESEFQKTADEYKKALDKFNQLEKMSKDLGIDLPNEISKLKSLIEYGLKDTLKSKSNVVDILAI